ncbi:MAG: beta-lactamase family protein [Parvularculaceae bacterium]|nr:beta-lactamase family protein [Parvularculaceae bacterium]
MTNRRDLCGAIDRSLDEAVGAVSGAVIVLQQGGQTLYHEARGAAAFAPDFPLRKDNVFGIFSLTKPVIAACACNLIAEGRIRADDKISAYIPGFAVPRGVRRLKSGFSYPNPADPNAPEPQYDIEPAERDLTIHDFLSSTSGLQTIGIPNASVPPVAPEDSLGSWVERLGAATLEFQPGSQWHYSNATGFEVVARVVEIAAGMSIGDYASKILFGPLGMSNTTFGKPDDASKLVPLGPLEGAPFVSGRFQSGSAGLFATAEDYCKFANMLLQMGRVGDNRILASDAVSLMMQNQIGDLAFPGVRVRDYATPGPYQRSGFTYGYGVAISENPTQTDARLPAGSYGWDGIGTRRLWVIPKYDAVLLMLADGFGDGADDLHRKIETIVSSAFA